MLTEVHRWSDRKKIVQLPMFSCYVFVQLVPTNEQRLRVLQTNGVISFVGSQRIGTAIPDDQIEAVRTLLDQDVACTTHPFLKIGQRVKVRGGALEGLEGVLVSQNGDDNLVISVDAIRKDPWQFVSTVTTSTLSSAAEDSSRLPIKAIPGVSLWKQQSIRRACCWSAAIPRPFVP